jgi:hypothetical protein
MPAAAVVVTTLEAILEAQAVQAVAVTAAEII